MSQKIVRVCGLLAAVLVAGAQRAEAYDPFAFTDAWARAEAASQPWHGSHYHIQYGSPLALVVPPTSHMRQTYAWGVSQNLMYPIYHQYGRNNPGYGYGRVPGFLPTPAWPSHTDQFGVYYVRGPW